MSTTDTGRARYTIDLDPAARERLNELAKTYKLTQGEAIEVLLDLSRTMLDTTVAEAMQRKRTDKLEDRAWKRRVAAKLRQLPPEKLAQVEALAS